jgi:CubicO group peptidase (beta-lactamase class C family)
MKRITGWLVSGSFLLLVPLALRAGELPQAQPEDVGISAARLDKAAAAVQQMVDKKEYAGAVTMVLRNGKVVHLKAVGMTDLDKARPMKTDTIFRIYSMTKPVTSVAAMMLCEEGKLQLDDPVAKYIPEFKILRVYMGPKDETVEAKRPMTIRDLLRHTSGLTYGYFGSSPVDKLYRDNNVLDRSRTLQEFVSSLATLPLQYQPGTRFHYSVSTDVLGRVVEVASGKSLDVFFAERIFQPLDMQDTSFFVPPSKVGRFATNYTPADKGGLKVREAAETSPYLKAPRFFSGGGGLVSTARDYSRFCQMMLNGGELQGKRLLKPETVQMMTQNQLPPEALPMNMPTAGPIKGLGFGLGFAIWMAPNPLDPRTALGEYWWGGAASTGFAVSPHNQTVVIALTQLMPINNKLSDTFRRGVNAAVAENGTGSSGGTE